jgi:hypothetical protein
MNILVNKNPVEYIINFYYPKIGKRNYNSMSKGYGYTFFDKKDKRVLFKYIKGGPVTFSNGEYRDYYPVRLVVWWSLYDLISSHISDPDKYIKEWFERTYDLNIEAVWQSN